MSVPASNFAVVVAKWKELEGYVGVVDVVDADVADVDDPRVVERRVQNPDSSVQKETCSVEIGNPEKIF